MNHIITYITKVHDVICGLPTLRSSSTWVCYGQSQHESRCPV